LCETVALVPRRDRVGEVFVVLRETENRVDGAAVDADLGDYGLDQLLALCGCADGDDVANPAA
jgi:hypothetical protein